MGFILYVSKAEYNNVSFSLWHKERKTRLGFYNGIPYSVLVVVSINTLLVSLAQAMVLNVGQVFIVPL